MASLGATAEAGPEGVAIALIRSSKSSSKIEFSSNSVFDGDSSKISTKRGASSCSRASISSAAGS